MLNIFWKVAIVTCSADSIEKLPFMSWYRDLYCFWFKQKRIFHAAICIMHSIGKPNPFIRTKRALNFTILIMKIAIIFCCNLQTWYSLMKFGLLTMQQWMKKNSILSIDRVGVMITSMFCFQSMTRQKWLNKKEWKNVSNWTRKSSPWWTSAYVECSCLAHPYSVWTSPSWWCGFVFHVRSTSFFFYLCRSHFYLQP